MDESLPSSVDVVVIGTGLPEAILASACARAGLSVLHLDTNQYYGGEWTSFTMSMIHEINEKPQKKPIDPEKLKKILKNQEEILDFFGERNVVEDVEIEWIETEIKEKLETDGQMRRFSIDLVPKVLLSKGAMVQTLCDSQVSHYAEFKLVNRQLCPTISEEKITLNSVPCSKGEIFQCSALSILEKRALMKFITFCTQWSTKNTEERREVLGEHADHPFSEFLKSMGVGETLQEFIINTLGILQPRPSAISGLTAACQFMDSVGHFGPSPFLFPLYGCGELSQCFCRLAAVFGSLYCLGRPVQAMIRDSKTNEIVAVIANEERIDCRHVIMSPRFVPDNIPEKCNEKVERVVWATQKSIQESEKEMLTLINLASLRPSAAISRIVETGFEACTAPKGHFLVHATGTREDDVKVEQVVERIFEQNDIHPYWKMSFTINSMKFDPLHLPSNVHIAPPVDASLHYGNIIEECQKMFCATWPDLDFLPRAIKNEEENLENEE